MDNGHNTSFPPSIDPQVFALIGVGVGAVIVSDLNAGEQNALGNWFELVGQYILTHAAQQQLVESRIQNNNININSKKYKNGGSCFTDNENNKSNQNQRAEVDFLIDIVKKMQDELNNLKSKIDDTS